MAITVKCPKCGTMNQLGRLFCQQCGARLEVNPGTVKTGTTGQVARRTASRILRWAVAVFLFIVIVQVLRPVTPAGRVGTPQDTTRMQQALRILNSAAGDNRPAEQTIEETWINAYLEAVIQRMAPQQAENKVKLEKANVELLDGRVIVVTSSRIGPVPLTREVEGVLKVEKKAVFFQTKGVRLGHLPLPPPVSGWVAGAVEASFSGLTTERSVLQKLDHLEIKKHQAVARLQGGAPRT